jgi:ubiquinone/menaquinone biosynthesis C-methylase UbiE
MFMEKILIPGMVNPQIVYRDKLRSNIGGETSWLDLGCGHKFFSNSLPDSVNSQHDLVRSARLVVGMDRDRGALLANRIIQHKISGNIEKLPFVDRSFNLITANMVIEHLSDPHSFLSEINRVLKSDGVFIFHTTNIKNYKILFARLWPDSVKKPVIKYLQNRKEEDVYPTCYRLNKPDTIRAGASMAGFELAEMDLLQGPADSVMLGPLVIFELLVMKFLSSKRMKDSRSNIITRFKKVREFKKM